MMQQRPATREEIIKTFAGRRIGFDTYVREVYDPRAENGVRHIARGEAACRVVDGVPVVCRHGRDEELFATHYTLETGRTFVASATIVRTFQKAA